MKVCWITTCRISAIALLLIAACIQSEGEVLDSIPRKEPRYFFSFRSSMLLCGDCDLDGNVVGLLSTVHGIRLNKTFQVGVGTGITSVSSTWVMPLFGNLRMNMYGKKRKNKVFIEMNYGRALAGSQTVGDQWGSKTTTRCESYSQPSIGYSIRYHDLRIGILVGIQAIRLNTRYEYPHYTNFPWGIAVDSPTSVTESKYQVSRMLVGLSIGWRD